MSSVQYDKANAESIGVAFSCKKVLAFVLCCTFHFGQ